MRWRCGLGTTSSSKVFNILFCSETVHSKLENKMTFYHMKFWLTLVWLAYIWLFIGENIWYFFAIKKFFSWSLKYSFKNWLQCFPSIVFISLVFTSEKQLPFIISQITENFSWGNFTSSYTLTYSQKPLNCDDEKVSQM